MTMEATGPQTPDWREEAMVFDGAGTRLPGILTRPAAPAGIGLVILPGGAQYRAGAHRQNVILARALARHGITCLRFDASGMGDATGDHPGFAAYGADLAHAMAALKAAAPGTDRVYLCGLCDGASAVTLNLAAVPAAGAILLNPWARDAQSLAATHLKTHYPQRALSPEFWRKLLTGRINPIEKAGEILGTVRRSRRAGTGDSLGDRLTAALKAVRRPVLVVLAGKDLTAAEFEGAVLDRLTPGIVTVARIEGADHTFSRAVWWQAAIDRIGAWLVDAARDAA
jgi:exosortase A-associated hydrolase 1